MSMDRCDQFDRSHISDVPFISADTKAMNHDALPQSRSPGLVEMECLTFNLGTGDELGEFGISFD